MARHQVLQHRLVSCTSAIPHPFCQRHHKIQFRASLVAPAWRFSHRAGSAFSRPLMLRPAPTDASRQCTTHLDLNNSTPHQNIHTHRQVLRRCLLPSEPLCRNGTTPPPAWTKPSRCILTLPVNCSHRYALQSPSIDTMRFLLDLHTDGLFHPHSLSCVPFSQTRAILSCVFFLSLVPLPPVLPSCLFFNHGPCQFSRCQNCWSQGFRHQGQDLCQEDQSQVQSGQTCP